MPKKLMLMCLFIFLSGCMSDVSHYQHKTPHLDLRQFLQGKITGHGIIQNWRGDVIKQFDFSGYATWHNTHCTFKEKMNYYSGKREKRIWHITELTPSHYIGKTKQVIGQADIRISGNAMNWRYQMKVKVDDNDVTLSFNDWMFLLRDNVIINRNYFKKFGFTVGTLTLYLKSYRRAK